MGYDDVSERSMTFYRANSDITAAEKPTDTGGVVAKERKSFCLRRRFQVMVAVWMSGGIPPLYRRIRRCQQGRCHPNSAEDEAAPNNAP
ncbi:hypothetical protein H4R19_006592 [Coemansia spiralis]|nr:hypothetical protein H4R19_006592 [Coemansia spiralis]